YDVCGLDTRSYSTIPQNDMEAAQRRYYWPGELSPGQEGNGEKTFTAPVLVDGGVKNSRHHLTVGGTIPGPRVAMALHGPDHSATSSSPGDAAGGLFFTRSLIRALAQSMHVPQSVPTLRSLDTCLSVRFPASTERLMSPSVTAWQRQTYMATPFLFCRP